MSEQPTREQQLHQIISELFSIIDHSTLNIATWPQVDALKARYQELQQEPQEPAMRYCSSCGGHHPVAAGEWYCPLDRRSYRVDDDGWSDKLADRGY